MNRETELPERTRRSSFLVYTINVLVNEGVWSSDTIMIAWHFWSTWEDASSAIRCETTRGFAVWLLET